MPDAKPLARKPLIKPLRGAGTIMAGNSEVGDTEPEWHQTAEVLEKADDIE